MVSSIQRKGRAGRLGPGQCFRLYQEEDVAQFINQKFSIPEQVRFLFLPF